VGFPLNFGIEFFARVCQVSWNSVTIGLKSHAVVTGVNAFIAYF
jgi:hypothetical protein